MAYKVPSQRCKGVTGDRNLRWTRRRSVQKVKVILTRSKLTEVNQNLIRSSMGNSQYCCKVWRQNSYSLLSYRVNKEFDLECHSDLDLGLRPHKGHSLTFPVHRLYEYAISS